MKKILSLLIIFLVVIAPIALLKVNEAKSAGEVLLTVEPLVASVPSGGSFTVNLNVNPAGKNINGIQFEFDFDPALVRIDSVTWGAEVDSGFSTYTIDNSLGKVSSAQAFALTWDDTLGDDTLGAFGDYTFGLTPFTLVTVNMTAIAAGSSNLTLPHTDLIYDVLPLIVSQSGDSAALPYLVTDNSITITGGADITPPSLSTSKITGPNTITLVYSEAVNTVASDYTNLVLAAGGTRSVTGISGSGTSTIVLTFSGTAAASETATMNIAATVVDLAANPLIALVGRAITDGQAPSIFSVSSDKINGSYKAGELIDIDVTFSEAVTSSGNITITLETGLTDQTCVFAISNSTTGSCNYTVQIGDTSSDLDAVISGTIADQVSNSLTNYVPATTLATNKALVIDTTAPANQDTVFASSASAQGGASITIISSGDATNNIWFAPSGTTTFTAGANMTTAGGTATSILAPTAAGAYKLFVVDAAGNYSTASAATLTVTGSAKNIISFDFASLSVTGTVDNTAHTVALTVPYGTDVTALVPTIVISANATISPLTGITQNFTNPVTYTVTAEDATIQAYLVTVTIAAGGGGGSGGGGGGGNPPPPISSVTNMSISINSGAASTNNSTVTLAIGATNAIKMAISNNADFSGGTWETFAVLKTWNLTSGNGVKTVYVKFQDASGYSSTEISDSITLGAASAAYPDGTLVKSSAAPEVYVVKDSQKIWIKTAEEFKAGGYKWENIKIITPEELAAIPLQGVLGENQTSGWGTLSNQPDGTLLKTTESFRVYVVISGKKKWIPTPEVFETLGYKWGKIVIISKIDLNKITDFEDNLIRPIGDIKVWLVVNGIRHHIPNPEVFLDYGFAWSDVKDVPLATVTKYNLARLVRETGQTKNYYLSPTGVKKLIPTDAIFTSYGNKWEDVQVISKKEMVSYATSNIMRYGGKLYLIEGLSKRLIPSDTIFVKNKYDSGLILDANKLDFDWYKTGSDVI